MNTNTKQENMSIADAADRLGLSLGALQLRLHRGSFPVPAIQYTDGGKRYFHAGAIEALATGGKAGLDAFLRREFDA